MIRAFRLTGRAIALWYDELFVLMILNLAWFLLQLPIVTAPAATAAMYVVAKKVVEKDYLELRSILPDLQRMFFPGITWGFANMLVIGVIVINFITYQDASGWTWGILRIVWGLVVLLWLGANLFYWPFWLAQTDRRLVTTYRNSFILLLKKPGLTLPLLAISITLAVVGTILIVPLVMVLISWIALIGVLAVEEALKDPDTPEKPGGT
jgi:uncharacterized membrane protein YesL